MSIEICWNITARCNQACKYCHRFLNLNDLTKEENFKVLDNLINSGVDNITFTGGEALLINYLDELIEKSHKNNIKTKLITNGKLLNEEIFNKITNSLDFVNLSIDSLNDETNILLGRGSTHKNTIIERIKMISNSNTNLSINSVATKINKEDLIELGDFLKNNNVSEWRIFKFMPLRETAIKNQNMFDISQNEYDKLISEIKNNSKLNIVTRQIDDFEKLYLLILANGDIFITNNGKDIKIGNALVDNISDIIKQYKK